MLEYPNKFFYYIAKQVISQCYSKQVANSFFDFEIQRRKKQNNVRIECFNGGAFISIFVSDKGITKAGNYSRCKKYNSKQILQDAINDIETLPDYYKVQPKKGIDCYQRCVTDIEKAKEECLKYWRNTYHREYGEANWYIEKI